MRRPGFFSRKYGVNFVRACPVKECVGLTHFQTKEIIIIQVSKNIFNKNDNNVGLLRTVKKYGYKKNTANNKIGMGLVISHTYNLSHAYLSHSPHCKAPYISGLIEDDRVARYRY